MKVCAIIQARGGSKGVPKKNIALLGGYPLIAYSIIAAKLARNIRRTIVSTDSEEIAEVAKYFGAEVPFFRPAEFAQDRSADMEVFRHAAAWFEEKEGDVPDLMVQLRPTTPLRDPSLLDRAIVDLIRQPEATSLRSAHELSEPPHKMFQLSGQGYFEGFFPDDPRPEYFNLPRQMLPKAYHPNGYVDIVRPSLFMDANSLYGGKIRAFVTPLTVEVDTQDDFERLLFEVRKGQNVVHQYLKDHFESKG